MVYPVLLMGILMVVGCSHPPTSPPLQGQKTSNWPGEQQANLSITPIQALQTPSPTDQTAGGNNDNGTNQADLVYLKGQVSQQVPLLTGQVYQLRDETGMIWVLTQDTVNLGDQLLIQGQVRYESIPLGGEEFGEIYVEEQQQLERQAASTSLNSQLLDETAMRLPDRNRIVTR